MKKKIVQYWLSHTDWVNCYLSIYAPKYVCVSIQKVFQFPELINRQLIIVQQQLDTEVFSAFPLYEKE